MFSSVASSYTSSKPQLIRTLSKLFGNCQLSKPFLNPPDLTLSNPVTNFSFPYFPYYENTRCVCVCVGGGGGGRGGQSLGGNESHRSVSYIVI